MYSPQAKHGYLEQLRTSWSNCQACPLHEKRKQIVFGYGNVDADIMIIGEAPGANEDEQGVPFVGNAGNLLDMYLAQASVNPEAKQMVQAHEYDFGRLRQIFLEEYYFTNVVMCRPPENRDPTAKELAACRARLLEQIYTVDPMLVIATGKIPSGALLGVRDFPITTGRGKLIDIDLPGRTVSYKLPVLAVLHPTYLLRENDFNQSNGYGERTFWDFVKAHHILDKLRERHYGTLPPPTRPELLPGKD